VRAERDGTIALALVTRRRRAGEWVGYAVTAQQHGYFRASGGASVLEAADGVEPEWAERWIVRGDAATYMELDPREPLDAALAEDLERLAHDFADEWVWFAAAPSRTPRSSASATRTTGSRSPANLRAAKLRTC